ncbi:unnamed protein product [Lepidochelys kempii]
MRTNLSYRSQMPVDELQLHADAFAKHKHNCEYMAVTIVVEGEDMSAQRQYPYPEQANPYIEKTIKSLLTQGLLRRCTSTANSPIWPMKKPNGSWRLKINYRRLNQVTPTCAPTVAKMPDLVKSFDPEAVWFTFLDISNSFWTLPLAHISQYPFAFRFQGVQYSWTRLPQGYKSSPALFHAQIRQALSQFSKPTVLFQYVDDLCLATRTKKEHLERLDELLQILKEAGLKCNLAKAQLMANCVSFLGLTLTKWGRTPAQQKVDAIQTLPLPQDPTALRSFLGLTGYYRDFIPNFASIAGPLYQLLKKSV